MLHRWESKACKFVLLSNELIKVELPIMSTNARYQMSTNVIRCLQMHVIRCLQMHVIRCKLSFDKQHTKCPAKSKRKPLVCNVHSITNNLEKSKNDNRN